MATEATTRARIDPKEWEGRIWVGDSLDFMRQLPDGCAAFIMWDWPYRGAPERPPIDDLALFREARRSINDGGSLILWDYDSGAVSAWPELETAGFRVNRLCPWVYRNGRNGNAGMRRCVEFALWASDGVATVYEQGFRESFCDERITGTSTYLKDGRETHRDSDYAMPMDWQEWPAQTGGLSREARERIHPQQKPEEVFRRWVEGLTQEGDLVLDPFLGSGTTAVVCERLGRRWIGCEINPTYVAMAEQRIQRERDKLQLPMEGAR